MNRPCPWDSDGDGAKGRVGDGETRRHCEEQVNSCCRMPRGVPVAFRYRNESRGVLGWYLEWGME